MDTVEKKIYMSWRSLLAAQKASHILDCIKRSMASRSRRVILSLLLHSCGSPRGVLHPTLRPPEQGTPRPVGAGLEKVHDNGQRAGTSLLRRKVKKVGVAQHEEKTPGAPYCSTSILKTGLQERQRKTFCLLIRMGNAIPW